MKTTANPRWLSEAVRIAKTRVDMARSSLLKAKREAHRIAVAKFRAKLTQVGLTTAGKPRRRKERDGLSKVDRAAYIRKWRAERKGDK